MLDMSNPEDKSRPDPVEVRLRRARVWCARAEAERPEGDLDVAFLSYWIAFNAAYAQVIPPASREDRPADWEVFRTYLQTLTTHDGGEIHEAISGARLWPFVNAVLKDKHLFPPFWDNVHDRSTARNWQRKLDWSARDAHEKLSQRNTHETLTVLFQRIYTLRNQVAHGGARWNSPYNRKTMKTTVQVLASLVPLFITVMENNPKACWGTPYYRVYPIYWPDE